MNLHNPVKIVENKYNLARYTLMKANLRDFVMFDLRPFSMLFQKQNNFIIFSSLC